MNDIAWNEAWGEAPRACGLAPIEREVLSDVGEVRRRLNASGADGWVCTVDRVRRFEPLADDEVPLSADLRLSDRESLALRYDGAWSIWRYVETDAGDLLALDEVRRTHDGRGVWRVYWARTAGPHGIEVYEPHAARLLRVEE